MKIKLYQINQTGVVPNQAHWGFCRTPEDFAFVNCWLLNTRKIFVMNIKKNFRKNIDNITYNSRYQWKVLYIPYRCSQRDGFLSSIRLKRLWLYSQFFNWSWSQKACLLASNQSEGCKYNQILFNLTKIEFPLMK